MHTSRRKVIKALGLLAGTSLAGSLPDTLNGRPVVSPQEKSKILGKKGSTQAILIGAGWRGARFARYALKHPEDFSITALAESDAAGNAGLSHTLNLPDTHRFEHWRAVFGHPKFADVVIIALKEDFTDIITAAVRAGYDVWVDRPASLDQSNLDAVNALARRHDRRLLYAYGVPGQICFMQHHFRPASEYTNVV